MDLMQILGPILFGGAAINSKKSGLQDFLFGKKEQFTQLPTLNEGQQGFQKQLLEMLGPLLGQGGNFLGGIFDQSPEGMKKFQQPYLTQFEQQTVPGIAERFSGMGAGAQGSSAFGQQLGAAGAGLQEQLASLQGQLGMQGMQSLMGLMGQGLSPSIENIHRPQTYGFLGNIGQGLGQGIGKGAGSYLGGLFS